MTKCCGASSRNSISSRCALRVRNNVAGGFPGMKLFSALLIALMLAPVGLPQAKPAAPKGADADRLGVTCAQDPQLTSPPWVVPVAEKTGTANDAAAPAAIRAITAYGKCYEARTNQVAASLGKSGRGPLMGALGNFRDFQKALDDFTAKALAATDKQPGTQ